MSMMMMRACMTTGFNCRSSSSLRRLKPASLEHAGHEEAAAGRTDAEESGDAGGDVLARHCVQRRRVIAATAQWLGPFINPANSPCCSIVCHLDLAVGAVVFCLREFGLR